MVARVGFLASLHGFLVGFLLGWFLPLFYCSVVHKSQTETWV